MTEPNTRQVRFTATPKQPHHLVQIGSGASARFVRVSTQEKGPRHG